MKGESAYPRGVSSEPTPAPLTRAEEDADVAFALEGVPWVRAVYAVDAPRADERRYLVHLTEEGKTYGLAEVHYALMRSRGRRESADVELVSFLPPLGRHRLLTLSTAAREAARGRARTAFSPEVIADVDVPPVRAYVPPEPRGHQVLVIDDDPETERAVRGVFPFPDKIVLCPYRDTAIALMMCWSYDRVIVAESFAFGEEGILARLLNVDLLGITPIAVLATPARYVEAMEAIAVANRPWQVLSAPVDAITLSLKFGRTSNVDALALAGQSAARACLGPKDIYTPPAPPSPSTSDTKKPAVLLVDATLEAVDAKLGSTSHLDVTIATGYWDAVEKLRWATFDTVLCDASARHHGQPLYRELWNLFPGLMARTILVTSPEAESALGPRSQAKTAKRLLARPLTAARVIAAVRSFQGVDVRSAT